MSASVATSITASAHTAAHTAAQTALASHPCKQLVRAYLARRCTDGCPPPAPEEIRRELGWQMLIEHVEGAPATHL